MGLMKLIRDGQGVFFALIAAVGFSVFPILARLAANAGVPDFQVVLVNELTNASVFLPLSLMCKTPLKGQNQKQTLSFVGTGVARVCSTTMTVLSYLYIPPAATIAISNGSSPLFAAVLSWLVRKERTGWINIIGMVVQVTAVGLVAGGTHQRTVELNDLVNTTYLNATTNMTTTTTTNIIKSSITHDYIIGVVLALAGTLGLATTNVLSRTFLQKAPQLTVLAYVEGLGFLLVFPAMYIINTPKWNLDIYVIGVLSSQGIIYTVSITCLYRSLKLQKASTVEILRGLSIALAYAFQYLILGVVALLMEYIGAAIIVVSIALVAGHKWFKTYKSDIYEVDAQATNIYNISATVELSQGVSNPVLQ
ncbi:SLC35G2 [Branchiostoma lanceolatum]|uniref:SLC35G2 protein n=1 Tax=Branchiostoma lanceolatum TaxID=7740 RepID=A0A8K0EDI2_BRALA|nr:SLC35G2 [Branchiostoma lanceolatum]